MGPAARIDQRSCLRHAEAGMTGWSHMAAYPAMDLSTPFAWLVDEASASPNSDHLARIIHSHCVTLDFDDAGNSYTKIA